VNAAVELGKLVAQAVGDDGSELLFRVLGLVDLLVVIGAAEIRLFAMWEEVLGGN
jgi:hypothetical protein